MSDPDQLPAEILRTARTIAVLGMKGDDEPDSPASAVPQYLAAHGYTVLPVNPELVEAGHPGAVATLGELKEPPDVVEVFRNPENVAEHADELLALRPKAVWLQLGIRNDEVARRLEEAGIRVVQDRCMKVEHHRLHAGERWG
ncbi:MAG TPA: CoA-binding protein [Longimicrobiaceae bacterium]|nr:CoA-binding protein [Longimicrobiaceae bacterium]